MKWHRLMRAGCKEHFEVNPNCPDCLLKVSRETETLKAWYAKKKEIEDVEDTNRDG